MPVKQIGQPPWSREYLISNLEAFTEIYQRRPIDDNTGGMKSPHMFATWCALRALRPKAVIESGVWKGQGTWLIEQACPDAELHCIDPDLRNLEYRSHRATYYEHDFSTIDWSSLPRADTLLFFDDHTNAYERLKTARWFGFRHAIFEDNYVAHGDCYSLKQAFMGAGFGSSHGGRPLKHRLRHRLRLLRDGLLDRQVTSRTVVPPNTVDAKYLEENLEVY